MDYKKGERVKHPDVEEWGIGQVLEDSRNGMVKVFFVEEGEKTLSDDLQLIKIDGKEAVHPLLDNLTASASGIKYQSLSLSIRYFLKQFPNGFEDKQFNKEERDYKVRAHQLAIQLLAEEDFKSLLEKHDYAEVCRRALKIVNATNLIFRNETMALKDGLKGSEATKAFAIQLFKLLHEDSDLESRFVAFVKMLEEIDAAKWTIASYFPFILYPDDFIFVKPTNTINAAQICAFEINYKSHPNWTTYKSVLHFGKYLRTEIKELKPRDMIDVQSFMWCIAPDKH